MNYSLVVLHGPDDGRALSRAESFAAALSQGGHTLKRVFFYGGGVKVALTHDGEPWQYWSELSRHQNTEIVLCSASADRYGITSPPEGFVIAGLGTLMEAGMDSDRVVTFV